MTLAVRGASHAIPAFCAGRMSVHRQPLLNSVRTRVSVDIGHMPFQRVLAREGPLADAAPADERAVARVRYKGIDAALGHTTPEITH